MHPSEPAGRSMSTVHASGLACGTVGWLGYLEWIEHRVRRVVPYRQCTLKAAMAHLVAAKLYACDEADGAVAVRVVPTCQRAAA